MPLERLHIISSCQKEMIRVIIQYIWKAPDICKHVVNRLIIFYVWISWEVEMGSK